VVVLRERIEALKEEAATLRQSIEGGPTEEEEMRRSRKPLPVDLDSFSSGEKVDFLVK
jgi:hypothetical protein